MSAVCSLTSCIFKGHLIRHQAFLHTWRQQLRDLQLGRLRDLVREEKELSLVKIRLEVMSRQPVWYVRETCWDPLGDCICRNRMEDTDKIEYHLHGNDSSETKENISLTQTGGFISILPNCWFEGNLVVGTLPEKLSMNGIGGVRKIWTDKKILLIFACS